MEENPGGLRTHIDATSADKIEGLSADQLREHQKGILNVLDSLNGNHPIAIEGRERLGQISEQLTVLRSDERHGDTRRLAKIAIGISVAGVLIQAAVAIFPHRENTLPANPGLFGASIAPPTTQLAPTQSPEPTQSPNSELL